MSGEERDPRHLTHHLKANLTSDHWKSLQMYNIQSFCMRSWVGGKHLPSIHLGLRSHQDIQGSSGPTPGCGAAFRTRPVRGGGGTGPAQQCGKFQGSRELRRSWWGLGGVTEGCAQYQEGPYEEESSDLFLGAQEQIREITRSSRLLGGYKMLPKLPSGPSNSWSKVGCTSHLGPSGINRPV